MNKPEVIMTVGLPGSGKSTWANEKAFIDGYKVFSSDQMRVKMFGDINYQKKNGELFAEIYKEIKEAVEKGENVILDATNIDSKKRIEFINRLDGIDCVKTARIFALPFTNCLYNNWMRFRKVPFEAMERMYRHWQTPFYFEGWDNIEVCGSHFESVYDAVYKLMDYDQQNPHHDKTLGAHLEDVCSRLENNGADEDLQMAGLMHDIGKPFVREFDKFGVAHYSNHAYVGAYDALSIYGLSLETSALITYHMHPMNWNDKVRERCLNTWGEKFFNKIMMLYAADKGEI